jgi:hypothetical protein
VIEGTISSYQHNPLESLLTVSFSDGAGSELTHRLGHKVYVLAEVEYRELEDQANEDTYRVGYDEGYEDGYEDARDDNLPL